MSLLEISPRALSFWEMINYDSGVVLAVLKVIFRVPGGRRVVDKVFDAAGMSEAEKSGRKERISTRKLQAQSSHPRV